MEQKGKSTKINLWVRFALEVLINALYSTRDRKPRAHKSLPCFNPFFPKSRKFFTREEKKTYNLLLNFMTGLKSRFKLPNMAVLF